MADTTSLTVSVLARLSALETQQFGSVTNYSDITTFERMVLARLVALEINKFGAGAGVPDTTSFTREVLDRLTALEAGGGGQQFSTLSAPTLTNYSALGAAPVTLQWSDTDYTVGLYGQLQIASDSGFSTITQNIVFFIDGSSWANLNESIGLVTPSGTYYARIRACRDDDSGSTTVTGFDPSGNAVSFLADVSPWSNTFTDTINASVNVWNTTTGTNKSQYVTVSGTPSLVVTGTTGVGAPEGVRGVTATTGKRHFEVKVTSRDGTDPLLIGIDDGTTALGPALFNPPNPGVYYSGGNIVKNGTTVQTGLASLATNDVLAVEFDTVGGTVSFYKNGTQIGTTVTGVSFSSYYSYCGTDQGSVLTENFGSSAFTMTPSSGYNGW